MSIDTNEINTEEVVEAAESPPISTERFLTFTSDGLAIGISTNYVTEIITNHSIAMLPAGSRIRKGNHQSPRTDYPDHRYPPPHGKGSDRLYKSYVYHRFEY